MPYNPAGKTNGEEGKSSGEMLKTLHSLTNNYEDMPDRRSETGIINFNR